MATSHAEIVSTVAACVAAGGASTAAVVAYLLRRGEINREHEWEKSQDEQRRLVSAIEKRTDWLRDRKITAMQDLAEALHDLLMTFQLQVAPIYGSSPVGDVEEARRAIGRAMTILQQRAMRTLVVCQPELTPIVQDTLLIEGNVLTPWAAPTGLSQMAIDRSNVELDAVMTLSSAVLRWARFEILEEGNRPPPYTPLPPRSFTGDDDENLRLLRGYNVRPVVNPSSISYEFNNGYVQGLRLAHPQWTPSLRIDALVIDTGDGLYFGMHEGLPPVQRSAALLTAASLVEQGLHGGPGYRDGADGSRIYIIATS